jgi:hypothetical protein
MSKTELKVLEGGEQEIASTQDSPESVDDFTEKLPSLHVDPTSFDARIAGIESCSVARELAKHWATVTAFEIEQEAVRRKAKGEPPISEEYEDKRFRELWLDNCTRRHPNPDDLVQFIKRKASHFITWGDIGRLWKESPAEGIELWRALRLEAREEFFSGHYGSRAFEVMSYQHEAWRRAQYLAIRDGLIEEWKPHGASEMILIDTMTQSYVMQLEWTEKAMKCLHGQPRLESGEFYEWKRQRKVEAKYYQWGPGDWDIPYQHEAEASEQAFRMVDLCQKTFQRALRQLANVRLVRAKTNRMKRRERAKTIKAIKVA